jgi:cytochrome c oxidase subunit I+III
MMPPPSYVFASLPQIDARDPLRDDPALTVRLARGEGYLGTPPPDGRRETLTVDVSRGTPEHYVVLPGNTGLPMLLAAVTGTFFLSFLLKLYWLVPIVLVAMAALGWRWAWSLGARQDQGPRDVGHGILLPDAGETDRSPGWWGSLFLLLADAVFFGSLIFGYAFLFTVAPGWPPPEWLEPSPLSLGVGLAGAAAAAAGIRLATGGNRRGAPLPGLLIAGAGTLVLLVALALLILRVPDPTGHAYGATLLVMGGHAVFHALLAGLMQAFLAARIARGFVSPSRRALLPIVGLWVDYTAAVAAAVLLVAHLPPLLG